MRMLFSLLVAFAMAHCQLKTEPLNMTGSYSMLNQKLGDGSKDSILNKKQFKIYTDHYMIYASHISETDSLADYGIGTYRVEDGDVIENTFYRALEGDKKDSAILKISKTDKGFKQVNKNFVYQNKRYSLSEEYERIGKPVSTPLDGAWKLIQNIYIGSLGDTVYSNVIQFKVFESGCFIWANSFQDPTTHKTISGFGYGTFEINGNKSTEVNLNSTYVRSFVGKPFNIELEFVGKDTYKQIVVNEAGIKTIEVYERLQ